jgi:CheY-like chemotaxis protein
VGLRPLGVRSVEEAIAALQKAQLDHAPFQLMLFSAKVSEFSGVDAFREIQATSAVPPSIYVCNFADHSKEEDYLAKGFARVIRRPIKQSEFLHSLLAVLAPGSLPSATLPSNKAIESPTKASASGGRILVAEDNGVNQLLVKKILESLGHSCFLVANGQEALAALAQFEFDVVLMDCQMPEMDGFQATREIRKMAVAKLHSIPIVALTANAAAEDVKRCRDAGMNDYLSKPMKKAQLEAILNKWLQAASRKAA